MAESEKNTQVASKDQSDTYEFQNQWRMEIN